MGEMRERMLRGELYVADDAENHAEFIRVQGLLASFNDSAARASEERAALLAQVLWSVGERVTRPAAVLL